MGNLMDYLKPGNDSNMSNLSFAQLFLARLEYLAKASAKNMTPALALMLISPIDGIAQLADGFRESALEADNEDRKHIFLDYYHKNQRELSKVFLSHCQKNIDVVKGVCDTLTGIAAVSPYVHTAIRNLIKEKSTYDMPEAIRVLENIEIMVKDEYLTRSRNDRADSVRESQDPWITRSKNTLGTMPQNDVLQISDVCKILDQYVEKSINPSKNVDNPDMYYSLKSLQYCILLRIYLLGYDTNFLPDDFTKCDSPESMAFLAGIPSKTPEGMIIIWDANPYPTFFREYRECNLTNMDMQRYLQYLRNWLGNNNPDRPVAVVG